LISRKPPVLDDEKLKINKCKFYSFDLENTDEIDLLFQKIVEENGQINRICFFQRYRGHLETLEAESRVSILATQKFIEIFASNANIDIDKSVVIVTSPADTKIVTDQPLNYHIAKAGLSQMIRYYALNFGSLGVRVNGISPGIVYKERAKSFYQKNADLIDLYNRITPLGRMGTPEDIASVIFFLSNSASSFVTGQIISVDGGLNIHENASLAKISKGI
jgi:NAD(P)-dependent dehydrogenase (short-subunit alcohol dehydrogenase family)